MHPEYLRKCRATDAISIFFELNRRFDSRRVNESIANGIHPIEAKPWWTEWGNCPIVAKNHRSQFALSFFCKRFDGRCSINRTSRRAGAIVDLRIS